MNNSIVPVIEIRDAAGVAIAYANNLPSASNLADNKRVMDSLFHTTEYNTALNDSKGVFHA